MFDLAAVTAIATVLLFFATWRAATAAKRSADIVAREFRLRSRPMVAVKWTPFTRELDHSVYLVAEVTEVSGIATTLHSVEASAASRLNLTAPLVVKTKKPNATLSGDVATYAVDLELEVPQALAGPDDITVATLGAKVVISAADEEADQETWQAICTLWYDRRQQQFVTTANPPMRRLSRRTGGRRSRIVDPVLGAWERWWDSVQ